jgi:hypothetical protein
MAPGKADSTLRLLAGLETGILGGLISFLWLSVFCVWYNERVFFAGNLIGSTVVGARALSAGLGKATFIGIALHLFACGLLGMVQGFTLRGSLTRSHAAAMLLGLSWSLLLFAVARRVNPLLWFESPRMSLLLSCVVFGICLSRFPNFYAVLNPPPVPAPEVVEPPLLEAPATHEEPPLPE